MSVAASQFLAQRRGECLALSAWLRRYWICALTVVLVYGLAQHWLYVNWTSSLPYRLVWVEYDAQPGFGDLMVYRFEGRPFHDEDLSGLRFFKRVAGVAGDRITVVDREVAVAGRTIGYAKVRTRTGEPLDPIAAGVISPECYFAQSDSADSFDSRYAQAGLVRADQVIGVAHVIF
jgi:conjugal transfer pilin signal peptidase TrbI